MKKEVQDLNEANVFEIISVLQKPKDRKVIQFIQSFKYKCSPLGILLKHKVRLCIHGGIQQKRIDCTSTFAHIVNWSIVRFLLVLLIKNSWY